MKLIRDRTPDLERAITRKVRDEAEHEILLRSKIMEEAAEVAASTSDEELVMEAGDLYTAMITLLRMKGISFGQVVAAAIEKQERKGNFDGGLVLVHDPLSNKTKCTI